MRSDDRAVAVRTVVRWTLGAATVGFAAFGLLPGGDRRWLAASAACGALWWAWDLIVEHVAGPLEEWVVELLTGGATTGSTAGTRPSLDDTIRLLEGHLARRTSRQVDLNAAIRLEEIYRTVKQDPAAARRVIGVVLERYPGAVELRRFVTGEGKTEEAEKAQEAENAQEAEKAQEAEGGG